MNRFSQISGHGLRLPMLELPYDKLDEVLGQKKQALDIFEASSNLYPKHIQNSPDDANVAGQITKYQQDVKTQLAEIAKTGDVGTYMQGLNQAQNQIKRLYQPGGPAWVLEQRLVQDEAEKKKLSEFYKDKPDWAHYAIQTRKYNNVGYNPSTGEYNPVNSFGDTPTYISAEKRNEWFNKNSDNIKNSILYDENGNERKGINKHQLDNISSVYDFWNVEGVPYDRLVNIYTSIFPKEFQESIYQDEKVNKFYSGDTTPIDTNMLIEDEKGNIKLNPKNSIAKEISGYATAGERYNKTHNYQRNQDEEKLKRLESKLRREEDRLKEGVLRFEGTSAVFNPSILPASSKDLDTAKANTQSTIESLQKEFNSTDDPQRRQNIASQITWNKAILDKQNQLRIKAENEVGASSFDKQYNISGATEQEKQMLRTWQLSPVESRKDSENIALGILKKYNPDKNPLDLYVVLQKYSSTKNDQDEKVDEWLKTNASKSNFEMNTIGVSSEEATAIKQSLNTNNWTFFDENGPVNNVETGTLLGTKDKPIISENVTIGGITKAPFGDLGNLVTLTDSKGKVYYASPKGGNVGKVIGNNIKNKAVPNSDQWMLGQMLSDPASAGILGQMTDMQDTDIRPIVSGSNILGRVEKKTVASGTLFTLHAPDGVIFPNGKTTMDYNNVENLTNDLQTINNTLNAASSN